MQVWGVPTKRRSVPPLPYRAADHVARSLDWVVPFSAGRRARGALGISAILSLTWIGFVTKSVLGNHATITTTISAIKTDLARKMDALVNLAGSNRPHCEFRLIG
jgi:hypothetical protein